MPNLGRLWPVWTVLVACVWIAFSPVLSNGFVDWVNVGLALARQGRSAVAITELREAVRRDRRNPEAHHVLAAILVSVGRIEEAAAEFVEVLYLRPNHAQARAFLAKARGRRM